MTDGEKLDLILSEVQGVKQDVAGVRQDVAGMEQMHIQVSETRGTIFSVSRVIISTSNYSVGNIDSGKKRQYHRLRKKER